MFRLSGILFFLLLAMPSPAQTISHKQLFVHFDAYTVQEDKLIHEALKNENIVYTCIASGIMVIEVTNGDAKDIQRITSEIEKVTIISSFSFLDTYTMQEAENSCAAQRSN